MLPWLYFAHAGVNWCVIDEALCANVPVRGNQGHRGDDVVDLLSGSICQCAYVTLGQP